MVLVIYGRLVVFVKPVLWLCDINTHEDLITSKHNRTFGHLSPESCASYTNLAELLSYSTRLYRRSSPVLAHLASFGICSPLYPMLPLLCYIILLRSFKNLKNKCLLETFLKSLVPLFFFQARKNSLWFTILGNALLKILWLNNNSGCRISLVMLKVIENCP